MTDKNKKEIRIKEVEIGDLIQTTYDHRRTIFIVGVVVFFLAIFYSLIATKIYRAQASFFIPTKSGSLMNSISSSKLPQFLSSYLTPGSKTDLFISFLESRTLSDDVINHFDLKDYYGEGSLDKTRRKLAGDVKFKTDKSDVISILVENKSSDKASEIANFFLKRVDSLHKKLNITEAGRQRVFLERRIRDIKKELSASEEEFADFQVENNLLNVEDQASATIEMIASLKEDLVKDKIELGTLKTYAQGNDIKIHKLKAAIKQAQGQLNQLKGKRKVKTAKQTPQKGYSSKDVIIPTKALPDASKEYLRRLRDVKVLQTIYKLLVQQHELAKLEEAKDSSTIMVLDKAVPPKIKYKPRRTMIVLIWTILSVIFSISFFFLRDVFSSILKDLKANSEG